MKRKAYDIFNTVSTVIMGVLFIGFLIAMDFDLGWPVVEGIKRDGWLAAFEALIAGAAVDIIAFVFFWIIGWTTKKTLRR